jgi:Reversibly glycosylated polypeptide
MNTLNQKTLVVVPWHNAKQKNEFLEAWKINESDPRLVLQQDASRAGCARTKNAGISRAVDSGADIICVLDDDCYPLEPQVEKPLDEFIEDHIEALEHQEVQLVVPTMIPHPRGFPYRNRKVKMPVAASLGFWHENPDFDAMSQLVLGDHIEQVQFVKSPMYGVMFPFCGMNFAFKKEWGDQVRLVDCARFDDIFLGWCIQKVAYERGYCFNPDGPMVRHVRQSNVWKNLQDEVKYLEINETIWEAIYRAPRGLTVLQLQDIFFGQGVSPEILSEKIGAGDMPVRSES